MSKVLTVKKAHIKSFGCQMNKLDSALVTSALQEAGYELTDSPTTANAVLINTCSVRERAEQKILSHLGNLKHIKESRPDLIVAVFGCMAQRMGQKLLEHPAVNIVAGPAQIPQIIKMLKEIEQNKNPVMAVAENIRHKPKPESNLQLEDFERIHDSDDKAIPGQAFVRAMRGCDKFCTYCIVPYVRGPEISRPPQAVIEQIKRLADTGVKQVTLLGQTINRYKYSENGKTFELADLLKMASEVAGIEWVRFITSHPAEFPDSILHVIADEPKVCAYLHVPAQSGSNKILKAMNRGYSREQYLELIDRARSIVPQISITSDFIVGFPGESEEDFRQSYDLIERVRFKNCFIFKYSPRPGTRADEKLAETVDEAEKKRRNNELLELQNTIAQEDNERFLGKTLKVLVEGLSKKSHLNNDEGGKFPQLIGRTADDYIVVFNGPAHLAGSFSEVLIEKTSSLTLFGSENSQKY